MLALLSNASGTSSTVVPMDSNAQDLNFWTKNSGTNTATAFTITFATHTAAQAAGTNAQWFTWGTISQAGFTDVHVEGAKQMTFAVTGTMGTGMFVNIGGLKGSTTIAKS